MIRVKVPGKGEVSAEQFKNSLYFLLDDRCQLYRGYIDGGGNLSYGIQLSQGQQMTIGRIRSIWSTGSALMIENERGEKFKITEDRAQPSVSRVY
jgi:hypothetical protein